MTAAPEVRLHACRPGDERVLARELARALPGGRHLPLGTGWVRSELPPGESRREACVAFAAQTVPDARPLPVPSVAQGARALADHLAGALAGRDGPWRLHVFGVEWPGSPVRGVRCALIARETLALLRRRRGLLAGLVAAPAAPPARDEWLAQLALTGARQGWVSLADPATRHRLRRTLSRFPGGVAPVADDPAPPSRAYRKLLEAEAHLARAIGAGETCVDLGAAPGGWTHVALGRGARVTAVDRSPLRADLMAHPGLTFVRGDAFRFAPPEPVDWLLADVAAFPQRAIALLADWLAARRCRRFVVTLKFRGENDYGRLEQLKEALAGAGAEFFVRRLAHNRNEVTAAGVAAGAAR